MELDELKKEWNAQMAAGHQQRSPEQITELLKGNTISMAHKIKKSVQLEIGITVVFAMLSLYVILFSGSWQYQLLFGILGVIALAFIVTLSFLLQKIRTLVGNSPVKQNLQKLIAIMEEYVTKYLRLMLFLLPVCFGFGVWLSYNDPDLVMKPLDTNTILVLAGVMTGLGAIIYLFTKWYLNRMYGHYIRRLNALLNEFEED